MRDRKRKEKRRKKKVVSRRDFIKCSATIGTATIAGMVGIKTTTAARATDVSSVGPLSREPATSAPAT